jgi:hypothetical protein
MAKKSRARAPKKVPVKRAKTQTRKVAKAKRADNKTGKTPSTSKRALKQRCSIKNDAFSDVARMSGTRNAGQASAVKIPDTSQSNGVTS